MRHRTQLRYSLRLSGPAQNRCSLSRDDDGQLAVCLGVHVTPTVSSLAHGYLILLCPAAVADALSRLWLASAFGRRLSRTCSIAVRPMTAGQHDLLVRPRALDWMKADTRLAALDGPFCSLPL